MKTKRYRYIYATVVAAFLLLSHGCKDYFDVGNNPNLITNPNINSLLSTATHKTGMNARTYGSLTSSYSQYTASPSRGSATDTYDITDQSGTWNAAYYAMADIYDMLVIAEEMGAYHHEGAGKIMMAYQLSLVSETWDSAPYTEAFMKVQTITPAYDSGEQLYESIGQLLQEGISALNRDDVAISLDGDMDVIHGGDRAAWLKTGYGMLARHHNRITKKSSYNPNAVLSALDNSYTSAADNMTMGVFNGNNPWASTAISNAGSLLGGWLSEQLMNHMNGTYYGVFDPRLPQLTDPTVNGDYMGTRNGEGNRGTAANTIKDETYISINSPITAEDAPVFIMTYDELKFVEAEAALRANQRARAYAAYLEGIRASMERFEVDQSDIDAYLAEPSVAVGESALTLALIFKEKYVSTYLNFEGWVDARRHDYAYEGFRMPLGAVTSGYIRRVAIPSTEISRNQENVPSQEPLDTPLWWDRP